MFWMATEPWNWAYAQQNGNSTGNSTSETVSPEVALAGTVKTMARTAQTIDSKVRSRADVSLALSDLRGLLEKLQDQDADMQKRFETMKQGLSGDALKLHEDYVKYYTGSMKSLVGKIRDVLASGDTTALQSKVGELLTLLAKFFPKERLANWRERMPSRILSPPAPKPPASTAIFSRAPEKGPNPDADDLKETIEIQFTPDLKKLAADLGHDPVKIYEYVRNGFDYEPYLGSRKGAQETFQEKGGNDYDQASLLMTLLRISQIPCRYVRATVEIPIQKAMNWVGAKTPDVAGQVFATEGVPSVVVYDANGPRVLRVEHVWVKAYVGDSYRGVGNGREGGWIELDPSFKQFEYKEAFDPVQALNLDVNKVIEDSKAQGTSTDDSFTLANKEYGQQLYQQFSQKIEDYWTATEQTKGYVSMSDFYGGKQVIKDSSGILPLALPYRIAARIGEYDTVPDNQRNKVRFTAINPDPFFEEASFTYTAPVPILAGKRVTLSYEGATQADQDLINSRGDIFAIPAYALQLKPVLWIGGKAVAGGTSTGNFNPCKLGNDQTLRIEFITPDGRVDAINHELTAGQYVAIGFDLGKVPGEAIARAALKYQANARALKRQIDNNLPITIQKDDIVGQFLTMMVMQYFGMLDNNQIAGARASGVIRIRDVSEGIAASGVNVNYLFGLPVSITPGGFDYDIAHDSFAVIPKDGNKQSLLRFTRVQGVMGSNLESEVPNQIFGGTEGYQGAVSTVKVFDIAKEQGIPLFGIDKGNVDRVLNQLQHSGEVRNAVIDAVNAGKEVYIPQKAISFNGWNGSGYMILDKDTGVGAYMISGGLSGGKAWWREALDKLKVGGTGWARDAIVGIILLIVGAFFPIAAAVAAIAWALISTIDTYLGIDENDKLRPETKSMLKALVVLGFIIAVILAIAGAFAFSPAAAIVAFFIMSILIGLAIELAINAAETIDQRNQQQQDNLDNILGQ